MAPHSDRPAGRAFTLIEILVVISIIALLVAISLPAIGAVRARAGRAKCLAGLRQFGIAFTLYGNDHRGLLPFADMGYSLPGGLTAPLDALEPYLSVNPPTLGTSGEVMTGAPFVCPADRAHGPVHGFSYGYIPAVFMSVLPSPQFTVTKMYEWIPSGPVLRDLGAFHRRSSTPDPGPPAFPGRNVLRFDGAARPAEEANPS